MNINQKTNHTQKPNCIYKIEAQKQLQEFLKDCNATGVYVPPVLLSKIAQDYENFAFRLLHSNKYPLNSFEPVNHTSCSIFENLSTEDAQNFADGLNRL